MKKSGAIQRLESSNRLYTTILSSLTGEGEDRFQPTTFCSDGCIVKDSTLPTADEIKE